MKVPWYVLCGFNGALLWIMAENEYDALAKACAIARRRGYSPPTRVKKH